jgi:hypothetical protein
MQHGCLKQVLAKEGPEVLRKRQIFRLHPCIDKGLSPLLLWWCCRRQPLLDDWRRWQRLVCQCWLLRLRMALRGLRHSKCA